MAVIPMSAGHARTWDESFLWDRQVRPLIEAITAPQAPAPRGLIVGIAGSGKTATLRRVRSLLAEHGRRVHALGPDTPPIARIPREDVLLVDDLHLLEGEQAAALRARAADPEASLIASIRPWPSSETTQGIARALERALPAIVLGPVSRTDLRRHLDGAGRPLPDRCVRHILGITEGVSWLVCEALAQHDEQDCADDEEHTGLHRALEARVTYRLDAVDAPLRRLVEELCVAPAGQAAPRGEAVEDLVRQGHAEGLLLRSGAPVPVIRSIVRTTIPAHRLAELGTAVSAALERAGDDDSDTRDWLSALHDPAIGDAMMHLGDRLIGDRPDRALAMYLGARRCGAPADAVAARLAAAHWARGDLDAAIANADSTSLRHVDGRLTSIAAGVWAARGMMSQADAAYRATGPVDAETTALAIVAATGVGSAPSPGAPTGASAAASAPSTLGVALDLLGRGLRTTLTPSPELALADLVRASEMYTSSGAAGAVPELPAVIAAVVALDLGATHTAQVVIDDALHGGHGGIWARPRLLLWRAWVAVQRAHPLEARESLERARQIAPAPSARDALLEHAVRVAIARRYEDASGLESAWRRARGRLLRTEIDLYLLHPLTELISAATRVGDTRQVQGHFARALEITAALGDPPLWITHLRWAGIQQGILLGEPNLVGPHARALVAASAEHQVAAVLARAGRAWTSVLGGNVDAAAVEAAAEGLASVGLKWDAARLAGHGAGRTDDRRVAARLLACARELHPTDGTRKPSTADAGAAGESTHGASEDLLSERELEVARLVLQGKTYAEIGEAIFISPRTAEHHIAHIRHRLGATSRSDVIAKLRQLLRDETDVAGPDPTAPLASPSLPARVSG